ncbi:DUF5682 family protein [Xanthomonas campestris]|uniref:DUF5682 family protein n=1 Tax=Xanthomonas campestris pv. papavericola TaxID=487881 RepID=A0AAJ3CFE5_XANCA|nr:DUF5682 family protein [Xanthomonas campestris]MEC3889726.1 DUF5682 family protein [Xanthomonas campestris pv. papavericola]
MTESISLFGIRHHGPGCARSLLAALETLQPDCVLIEGPAGTEALLSHVLEEGMRPPVALLSYSVDDPQLAVFHPYAMYSPEWQAMRWALRHGTTLRFMDVPPALTLEWQSQARASRQTPAREEHVQLQHQVDVELAAEEASDARPADPLDWLARAAGHADGESWWNHMVEERGDGQDLFAAIAEAMTAVREHTPDYPGVRGEHEAMREAHMRSVVRSAGNEFARVAVVCGAWHVPALQPGALRANSAAADNRLLKGMPRRKTQSTWVPWTYRHLSVESGYGAGVEAPGWYDHLWSNAGARNQRTVGWYARVGRMLREHGLDCSSAHLIEATRLADTLAAFRGHPAPGLEDIAEASRAVICNGDDAPMRLIREHLMVGDALGQVPASVPVVPLQRDLEAHQKRLRLKPEALEKTLDLDLRKENDLARSHLLHRLRLIGIEWGRLARTGHSARGTFHEIWQLAWQPHFQVDLVEASRHGQTLLDAASSMAVVQARSTKALADLSALVDQVLLADLPQAVHALTAELEARAATDADPLALLGALPPLANILRYGNVRQTEGMHVVHLFDSMLERAAIGLKLALVSLDEARAEHARTVVLDADRAIGLRSDTSCSGTWQHALQRIALSPACSALLRGVALRLLFDTTAVQTDTVHTQLQQQLSQGAEPLQAAQWLDGFLNRNATVLLHDDAVWQMIDGWVIGLDEVQLVRVLPLVRRTFAAFENADRRALGVRVKQAPAEDTVAVAAPDWNEARAERALPMLRELLGLPA